MPAPDLSADEIESGRKLFAGRWDFALAAASLESLPPPNGVEIDFTGRSNVGKSSLINALTGRKALARTSHTPGRTQELVFFQSDTRLVLVDMPGYGFAQAPKAKVAAWTALIHAYLKGRTNLARVYVLVDARRGLTPADADVLGLLDQVALSYQIVLTKCDQVSAADLAKLAADTGAALAKHPAAFPFLAATSARNGDGMAELRGSIARLLAERVD